MELKTPEANEFGPDFRPSNVTVLGNIRGRYGMDQVWTCIGEFKSQRYFNIRQVYKDQSGLWLPGKGLAWSVMDRADINIILSNLGKVQCP